MTNTAKRLVDHQNVKQHKTYCFDKRTVAQYLNDYFTSVEKLPSCSGRFGDAFGLLS